MNLTKKSGYRAMRLRSRHNHKGSRAQEQFIKREAMFLGKREVGGMKRFILIQNDSLINTYVVTMGAFADYGVMKKILYKLTRLEMCIHNTSMYTKLISKLKVFTDYT